MNKKDAKAIARRALRDGFHAANIQTWGLPSGGVQAWKVVLQRADPDREDFTVFEYDEYEQRALP